MEGLKTCLLVHSQDPTVEKLMGCRIGSSPRVCDNNVSVVRLETSKVSVMIIFCLFNHYVLLLDYGNDKSCFIQSS